MVETILIALVPGTCEGILAAAIILIYRSTGVVNVAVGAAGTIGVCLADALSSRVPLGLAAATGIIVSSLCLVALTYAIGGSRLTARYPRSLLASLFAAVIIEEALDRLWSSRFFPSAFPDSLIVVVRYEITPLQIAAAAAGLLVAACASLALRSQPQRLAESIEVAFVPFARLRVALILVLAGVAASLSAWLTAQGSDGPGFMALPTLVALLAAIIARFRSIVVAFVAAMSVEVIRNVSIRFAIPEAGYTAAFILVVLLAAIGYSVRRYVSRRHDVRPHVRATRLDY